MTGKLEANINSISQHSVQALDRCACRMCLYNYAQYFNILSSAQEGFKKQGNTIQQLQKIMNVMSDAKSKPVRLVLAVCRSQLSIQHHSDDLLFAP